MKRLLIATDGSSASRVAVEEGIELARELGARVLFVCVEPAHAAPQARRAVEAATEEALARGVDADWEILYGEPAHAILGLARERSADLIVVGSRGRGAPAGTLLGSVSQAIVCEADRPILVARARARARRLELVAV
jgi:nucleotide-binding universal stress UspA family protein